MLKPKHSNKSNFLRSQNLALCHLLSEYIFLLTFLIPTKKQLILKVAHIV